MNIYNEKPIKINKKKLKELVNLIATNLNAEVIDIEFNFVNSGSIHIINRNYLNHDYSTDIITFNYSNESHNLAAEIFISIEDALVNSKKFVNSLDNEVLRLVVHGILHLVGYDDMSAEKKRVMKRIENKLVKEYNSIAVGIVEKYEY
ncbi:MAG: rRNA maturation RNase YbeY [Melioribacteraceae bacterium]|nr:rRNA maturation RNase YbeY [Melioribacteraceae bacterium]